MKRLLPLAVVLVAAGVAALAVNLLLVDYASGREDPVGNLSPRATLPEPATTGRTPTGTTTTTRGGTTTDDDRVETSPTTTDDDDSSGRGRGRNRGRGGSGSSDDD